MKIIRLILSALLAASALAGVQILSTDYWLWSAESTHAYGLMVFVALDIALMLGMWRATRPALFGALLTATVQLTAMLGDLIGGQPLGTPAVAFRSYLLADTAYLGLLIAQAFIVAIAMGTWALPHLHGHGLSPLKTVKE